MDELQDALQSDAVSGAQEDDANILESIADTVQEGGSGHGTIELTHITVAGVRAGSGWPAYIILVWLSSIQLYPLFDQFVDPAIAVLLPSTQVCKLSCGKCWPFLLS